jgi:hypothetical protein
MLPFDCFNHIITYTKDHQSIVSLVSTTSYYFDFRKHIRWNKSPVWVSNVIHLPFYNNIEHIFFTKEGCFRPPRHLRKITVKDLVYSNSPEKYKQCIKALEKVKFVYPLKVYIKKDVCTELVQLLFKNEHITNVFIALRAGCGFDWPKNLETLTVNALLHRGHFCRTIDIPIQVKKLKLTGEAQKFNPATFCRLTSLTHLELTFGDIKLDLSYYKFPKNLKTIVLDKAKAHPGCFPEGIEEIVFIKPYYYHLHKNVFPDSVKRIIFLNGLRNNINGGLPPNLEYLYIGGRNMAPFLYDLLPKTLKEIVFAPTSGL